MKDAAERSNPVHAALHFLLEEHKAYKPDNVAIASELQEELDDTFLKDDQTQTTQSRDRPAAGKR
jgi:hypothetical protein